MNLIEQTRNRILNWHNDQLPREGPADILADMLGKIERRVLAVSMTHEAIKAAFAKMRGE